VVAALCWPGGAAAQSAAQKAAAEALFKEGLKLLDAGNADGACAKLAESLRLDPTVSTHYQLGRCHEQAGRLASSWSSYVEAAKMAQAEGDSKRAAAARSKADKLEPKLSKVRLEVPAEHRVEGLLVTMDGEDYGAGSWGTDLPADPGDHELRAKAPGHETWRGKVVVPAGGGIGTATIPKLAPAPAEDQPASPDEASAISGAFWGGLVAVVIGVGGMVAGGVLWANSAAEVADREADIKMQREDIQLCIDFGLEPELCETGLLPPKDLSPVGPAVLATGAAVAGVGAVLMIVFAPGSAEEQPDSTSYRVEPLIGPAGGGVRIRF